jgi:hypothetical protein
MNDDLTLGLLALDMPDEAIHALYTDIHSEVQDWRWTYVRESGVEARVMGCLIERRLAGEVTPNVCAAIALSGSGPAIIAAVHADDKMLLNKDDLDALEAKVFTVMSEIGQKRIENRTGRLRVAKPSVNQMR